MDDSRVSLDKWYIVFGKTNLKHWIFNLLHPDFQHVYAMKKSRGGHFWCIVNPKANFIEAELEPVELYPEPESYAGNDCEIVEVLVDTAKYGNIHQPCIMNCTEIVKGILGINDWLCWTPYQLYKKIGGQHDRNNRSRQISSAQK